MNDILRGEVTARRLVHGKLRISFILMSQEKVTEEFGLMVIQDTPTGPDKVKLNFFHALPQGEYDAYRAAASSLQNSSNGNLLVYAKQSLANLESVCAQVQKFMRTVSIPLIQLSAESWRTSITCCVLTFCSALNLHQEQSLADAKRHHGPGAAEVVEVKQFFSQAYDSSFAYRLMYRLRNVLVHHSLRCVGLFLSAKETSPSGLIVNQYEMRVPLLREIFLGAKQNVSAATRQELQDMSADPDILMLCREAMLGLERVDKKIRMLVNPGLLDDAAAVHRLNGLFEDIPGGRALAQLRYGPDGTPKQIPHSLLTPDLFEYAAQLLTGDPATSAQAKQARSTGG